MAELFVRLEQMVDGWKVEDMTFAGAPLYDLGHSVTDWLIEGVDSFTYGSLKFTKVKEQVFEEKGVNYRALTYSQGV